MRSGCRRGSLCGHQWSQPSRGATAGLQGTVARIEPQTHSPRRDRRPILWTKMDGQEIVRLIVCNGVHIAVLPVVADEVVNSSSKNEILYVCVLVSGSSK